MINHWWVTRPKRRLNSVPEVLSAFAEVSLDQEWQGQRSVHLSLEEALEEANLKRKGDRRDQTGGGGRTYQAWLSSLGLLFVQEQTQQLKLTLAGEAIMNGEPPVEILKNQILKYQFPSAFSMSRNVNVSPRFKIRPFRFLLRLLSDSEIGYLTQEEIAAIVITEGENESEWCFQMVKQRVLLFREQGENCLSPDFEDQYASNRGKGDVTFKSLLARLNDTANTIINWLEFTQLAKRNEYRKVYIIPEKTEEVNAILSVSPPFIDRPEQQEIFQRKFGLDPKHKKDTRNLSKTRTITAKIIADQKVKNVFISESLKRPISKITSALIERVSLLTGLEYSLVEDSLYRQYPKGAVGGFMTEYFEMAFKGRDEAVAFEKATVELFNEVFGMEAKHVGPVGLTPDVLVLSDSAGFCGIIDNKAYSSYTISNDHKNRMIHNYIGDLSRYYSGQLPLAFYSYIAGGFGANIDKQIKEISDETAVKGSAISVSNVIDLVRVYDEKKYTHKDLHRIFSLNRKVLSTDL